MRTIRLMTTTNDATADQTAKRESDLSPSLTVRLVGEATADETVRRGSGLNAPLNVLGAVKSR